MRQKKIVLIISTVAAVVLIAAAAIWQLFVGCSIFSPSCVFPNPQITLTADHVQGKAPHQVEFTVEVEELLLNHPQLYCANYRFDNGVLQEDVMTSCAKPSLEDSGWSSRTEAFSYKYIEPGEYKAQFHILKDDKEIYSSNVVIVNVE